MSQFMSNKYLRYPRWSGAPIERDLPCENCGYNLRGLSMGGRCPECGDPIGAAATSPDDDESNYYYYVDEDHWLFGGMTRFGLSHDVLHTTNQSQRRRWQFGLALAVLVLAALIIARLTVFIGMVLLSSNTLINYYLALQGAFAFLWIIATLLLTPRSIDGRSNNWRLVRYAVRFTSFGFVIGMPALIARAIILPGTPDANLIPLMHTVDLVGRGLGGLGAIGLALLMYRVALGAELDRAAWRLNGVVWLLPLPTVVLALLPQQFAWFTAVPMLVLLLFWAVMLERYALALFEMQRSVTWAGRHDQHTMNREQRIAARREEMEKQLANVIRPLPQTPRKEINLDE